MGSLFKPRKTMKGGEVWESKTYWAKYRLNGKVIRRNTKKDSETKAKRVLTLWEGNLHQADPRLEKVTIDELAKDYLNDYRLNHRRSIDQAKRYAERILKVFGGRKASTINAAEVKEYILLREKEGAAPATINRDLSALIRMFTLGKESGKVLVAPLIKKLKESNVRKGFMGEVEHLAITEHMPFWAKVMCEAAYTFGWREQELLTLKRSQLDFTSRHIRLEVGTTKNDEGRNVKMTERLYEMLQQLEKETKETEARLGKTIPVVFHRNGRPVKDFRGLWENACKAAKVERLFHDYRRTAVRNMERARVPRSAAMNITGHKTESIYRRYAIVDQETMDDATARIEAARTLANAESDGDSEK